jgi:hypothetical protein
VFANKFNDQDFVAKIFLAEARIFVDKNPVGDVTQVFEFDFRELHVSSRGIAR